MKVVLDTNCFIDRFNPIAPAYESLQLIFSTFDSGRIEIAVSRHSVEELSKKEDAAYELAKTLEVIPYWPIGTIGELVGTIEQLAGTWDDARRNEGIQKELQKLANAGNSLRDRGPYIDALRAGADAFVTSDNDLVGKDAPARIQKRFDLRVLTPSDLAQEIEARSLTSTA